MPKISACIVAYCDYDEVCAAVRSILHYTPAPDLALYCRGQRQSRRLRQAAGRDGFRRQPRDCAAAGKKISASARATTMCWIV